MDQSGALFVADSGNHRIVRWSPGAKEGVLVASGVTEGRPLYVPKGVIVDEMGNIYAMEYGIPRITRWTKDDPYNGVVIIVDQPTTNNPVPLSPHTCRYE